MLNRILWMLAIMPALGGFAFAQVEKAAMKTTGISCGMCAAVSEVYLRQLPGIDKIKISLSQEAIMVSYKPGAAFQPKQLHEALKKTDVGIVQLQIGARGRIEGQGEKRFFVAGNDRFAVVSTPNGPEIPVNTPLTIEGILNDQVQPMQLKILAFKAAK
jgi:copper chaperone CopZ